MMPSSSGLAGASDAGLPSLASDPLAERSRIVWSSGDFGRIAAGYARGAAEFVARLELERGERVLDVACGTGNLALPAARAGASVVGLDLTPNLLAQARDAAAAERLSLTFDLGDAERMPYESGAFTTVMSMFGVMFAARPQRAAAELLRVTRPGGRTVMANWTSRGFVGEMLRTTARHVPPPRDVPSPLEWGVEDVVRSRLEWRSSSIRFERRLMTFEYDLDPEGVVSLFRLCYGPTLRAFAALDDAGRDALHEELVALWRANNLARDGTTRVESEYLEVSVRVK